MINKLYVAVLNYIKYNYLFLTFIILMLVGFNIETGYSIYKPGGSINITARISSNQEITKSKGTLNMAYVGMIEGKLPFYLLAHIFPSWDLVENKKITYDEDETIKDSMKRDHIYYNESISNAKYLAYVKSETAFEVAKEANIIVYVSSQCTADIKIGDEILEYDDIKYTRFITLKEYIKAKEVGDSVKFLIKRGDKKITTTASIYLEDDYKLIGLSAATIYDLKSDTEVTIDSKATESGPSGGLMLTLAIYNTLVKEDITKGNKIVGTGTIDIEGSVGGIGGVKYKLGAAVKAKADLFIVPEANYEEAVNYAKEKKYDIKIAQVATFDDALKALAKLDSK